MCGIIIVFIIGFQKDYFNIFETETKNCMTTLILNFSWAFFGIVVVSPLLEELFLQK
jgi:hypothetical protein